MIAGTVPHGPRSWRKRGEHANPPMDGREPCRMRRNTGLDCVITGVERTLIGFMDREPVVPPNIESHSGSGGERAKSFPGVNRLHVPRDKPYHPFSPQFSL